MSLTLWALKASMLTKLTPLIAAGDADIVQLGLPTDTPPTNEPRRVYILNVPEDVPNPVYQGSTQTRKEEYVVPIALEVVDYTGNATDGQSTVLTDMQTLYDNVEAILLADPSWGGVVHQTGLSVAAESTGPIAGQAGGWISKTLLELHAMRRGV